MLILFKNSILYKNIITNKMSNYKCEKCLKIFQKPAQLSQHNKRKTPCNSSLIIKDKNIECNDDKLNDIIQLLYELKKDNEMLKNDNDQIKKEIIELNKNITTNKYINRRLYYPKNNNIIIYSKFLTPIRKNGSIVFDRKYFYFFTIYLFLPIFLSSL